MIKNFRSQLSVFPDESDRKDKYEMEKQIEKAKQVIEKPSKSKKTEIYTDRWNRNIIKPNFN